MYLFNKYKYLHISIIYIYVLLIFKLYLGVLCIYYIDLFLSITQSTPKNWDKRNQKLDWKMAKDIIDSSQKKKKNANSP